MAIFEEAEKLTGASEGGYADNKADRGKETLNGIARAFWSNWGGWKFVDAFKSEYNNLTAKNKPSLSSYINSQVKSNAQLKKLISQFYKQNFWDVMKLDLVNDQQLANSVYDFGVNSGTGRSAKFLQQAVNNVCGVELDVDGQIGNKTITEVNKHDAESIYKEFNMLRENFYRSIAKGSQSQFLKSWLSRLKPYQK